MEFEPISDLDYWEENEVFKDRELDEWDDTSDTNLALRVTAETTSVALKMGAPLALGVDIGNPKGLQEAWWPIARVITEFLENGNVSKVTIVPLGDEGSQKMTADTGAYKSENEMDDLFTYSMCEHPTISLTDRNIELLTKSSVGLPIHTSLPIIQSMARGYGLKVVGQ